MDGKIIRVVEGERFVMFLIWLEELSISAKTYTWHTFRNFDSWKDLKAGDHIGGLQWKNEKRKLLDADSPVFPS